MPDEVLLDIINLCLALDKKASEIYLEVAGLQKDGGLRDFWKGMVREENEHVSLWKKLLVYAKEGAVPQIFHEPYVVRNELQDLAAKVDILKKQSGSITDTTRAFLLAYRLEYYMLHPAFETLLNFIARMDRAYSEYDYGKHLQRFMEALQRYGASTPELELLGEAIYRLWKENRRLVIENNTDSLTGVLNRQGFFRAMKPLAFLSERNQYNAGYMMIDIDDFKKVNDTHGHQAGDEVLKSIAGTIRSHMRVSDIVGRYGGEEFIVYLPQVGKGALYKIAELIRNYVELDSIARIPVTISIGAVQGFLGKDVEKEVGRFIGAADDNLYKAKGLGKNRVVISDM